MSSWTYVHPILYSMLYYMIQHLQQTIQVENINWLKHKMRKKMYVRVIEIQWSRIANVKNVNDKD